MHLTHAAAQALMVAAQGLHRRPEGPASKLDLLETIRRMGVLQIDTIHVVARSPYLVLWSRLGAYPQEWLTDLLAERALFEYWAHEACFLPIESYRLFRHRMLDAANMGWKYAREWAASNAESIERVLAYVREYGPVRSADFERTDGSDGKWWGWKTEKRALETLFTSGELMIARRHNFQRIYDLRERILPDWDDGQVPPIEQVRRTLALHAVCALGVTTARWVADYFRTSQRDTAPLPPALAAEGALIEVAVEGWQSPAYIHPDNLVLAEMAADGTLTAELTTLLSPFDPLVWDRARALAMFGFDYRIECYTPAPKRRYGYFTLPILWRGQLIGRLDPKAHRKDGRFEVKALHLEPGVRVTGELVADIAGALRECAVWHETPTVEVRWSDPPSLAPLVQQAVDQAAMPAKHTRKL
ncbi:MAG TPA: crosslink repair DNA glycosylase YcaQ family protein [Roseiflexaceae bacterium]|nr:crosslink repair DNA glycosylase YcaQ family protein [Roseiflexaceae bacterium]